MLSKAEGLTNTVDDMAKNMAVFRVLVAGTALHRKNLIKAHFENMTFGEDGADLLLFEKN